MEHRQITAASGTLVASAPDPDETFRLLADAASVMIWRAGLDRRCNYFNKRWLDFTGRSIEQELGLGWTRGIHPDDYQRCIETFQASLSARLTFTIDYHLRRHDGAYRWILSNGVPYYRDGELAGFLGTSVDISDHLKERRADPAGVEAREAALRELNHRVKNSMQTSICFSAFGRPMADLSIQDELSRTSERLSLLALAYEKLGVEEGSGTAFCDYIQALAESVHATVGSANVSLAVSCEPITLGTKRAIAVGSIVDELLTIALTQRFPPDRTGTVRVQSRALPDQRIEVSVADDGVAPEETSDAGQLSLQRQMVERLTAHANGTIRYELSGARRCIITLNPD